MCWIQQLLLFAILVLPSTRSSVPAPSPVNTARFIFDKANCHETLRVLESGSVVEKLDGEDYQTVLLTPPIPVTGG